MSARRSVRILSVILALAAGLATACSPHPDEDAATEPAHQGGERSALGEYLAARVAQSGGDSQAAAAYYTAALERDPDNVDLMQRAFTLMVAEGDFETAAPLGKRLLALDSDTPLPALVLGVEDVRAGRLAEAQQRFASLPKHGIGGFLGPLLAAWAEAGQGRTDAALDTLAPLTHSSGMKPLHAFHSGLINDLADRTAAAEEGYKVALSGQLNIRTVEAAGSLYQRSGRPDQAKALYDRYIGEHPETMLFDGGALLKEGAKAARTVPDARAGMAEAMFDVASLMRQSKAPDFAMVFSRLALSLQPDFPLAQMTAAEMLSLSQRYAEANELFRAINPASPVYAFGRLRVATNLDDMGDTDGALAELTRLAAERPTSLDPLVTIGDLYRKHLKFAEAAAAYTDAIARLPGDKPGYWALYYSRGIAWERAHQWPKAEADLLKALALEPDQPDVLNYLGYSWIDLGINLDKGRAMIEKAVDLRPDEGAIVDSLGWALYRLGDYQNAVRHLERAIELKADDPTISEHLGDAYWQVGRHDEARYQWTRALGFNPEPEMIDGLKQKVRTGKLPAGPAGK